MTLSSKNKLYDRLQEMAGHNTDDLQLMINRRCDKLAEDVNCAGEYPEYTQEDLSKMLYSIVVGDLYSRLSG